MKLFVNGKDITQLVDKAVWSGDSKQVSRKLDFSVAYKATDYFLPKVSINVGDKVTMLTNDGKTLFYGVVFNRQKSATANIISYVCFDLMIYITKSKINRVFDSTPEEITRMICTELGVPFDKAAATGIRVYMPSFGKPAYEAIMAGYTKASRQNGKKYMPAMNIDKVTVIEKGAELAGIILDSDYNISDAAYGESIENMVSKVLITDNENNIIGEVENAEDRRLYGTIQEVYREEEEKDARTEARSILKGLERTAAITGISNYRCIAGYAVAVREPVTGLYGKFYIESDTHIIQNGHIQMQLNVAFENLMDEKEIEEQKQQSGSGVIRLTDALAMDEEW